MFDELDKNMAPNSAAQPARPTPVKAEDIFSEVDKVKPEAFRPKVNDPNIPPDTVIPAEDSWLKNKGIILGLVLGGFIIVLGGGFLVLKLMIKDSPTINTPAQVKEEVKNTEVKQIEEVTPIEETNSNEAQIVQPVVTQPIDTDQDGLTDEEENDFRTDINNTDTDQDGLTDRQEVKVYKTDPLNPDSDGDGYLDGEELKNGFDPNGPGKLLDINQQ